MKNPDRTIERLLAGHLFRKTGVESDVGLVVRNVQVWGEAKTC